MEIVICFWVGYFKRVALVFYAQAGERKRIDSDCVLDLPRLPCHNRNRSKSKCMQMCPSVYVCMSVCMFVCVCVRVYVSVYCRRSLWLHANNFHIKLCVGWVPHFFPLPAIQYLLLTNEYFRRHI